jgi:hypothetical protein
MERLGPMKTQPLGDSSSAWRRETMTAKVPLDVKAGDTEKEYLVLRKDDVLAILD